MTHVIGTISPPADLGNASNCPSGAIRSASKPLRSPAYAARRRFSRGRGPGRSRRPRSEAGAETEPTAWPAILGCAETSRPLVAGRKLRQGFRHFGADRIVAAETLGEPIGLRSGELRRRWRRWREAQIRPSPGLRRSQPEGDRAGLRRPSGRGPRRCRRPIASARSRRRRLRSPCWRPATGWREPASP
jgi:hypothetical protein